MTKKNKENDQRDAGSHEMKLHCFYCASLYKVTRDCVAMVVADYDAPVAENGDLKEKYFIIKNVLHEMLPNSEGLSCLSLCFVLS